MKLLSHSLYECPITEIMPTVFQKYFGNTNIFIKSVDLDILQPLQNTIHISYEMLTPVFCPFLLG